MNNPDFRLVADFGAGIYVLDAKGSINFSSLAFASQAVSDKENKIGFRGRVLGGLKFALSQSVSASVFGGIDYWSETPYAALPVTFPAPAARLRTDDLIEVKAGVSILMALSNGSN